MKRLKKIPKKKILTSNLWRPPEKEYEFISTNSWFKLERMCDDSYKTDEIKRSDQPRINVRSYPISLFPDKNQKNILLQWNEIYRQVYNLTVKYCKTSKVSSFISMRPIIDRIIDSHRELKILNNKYHMYKHIRDNAIKDCIKAYRTGFSSLRSSVIKHFRLRYKKKSHYLSSIVIEPKMISKRKNGFCIETLNEMKSSITLENITKECRLTYNSRKKNFTLRVPHNKETHGFVNRSKIISLDPGMRVFQTGYSPDGSCYKICSSENKYMHETMKKIRNVNKINSNHKKYLNKLREKLRNRIADLHWKTAKFLCQNFDVVLLGNMSTKSIISNKRNLHSNVKNHCVTLSHYLFQLRLKSKAEEYDTDIRIVDESYTSKTCGGCGEINESLGSSKNFECKKCNFKCDRDINAARNILIKNF